MQEDTIAMAFSIMSSRQKEKFKNNFEIDIAYSVPGLGRFRCNIFQQRGTVGLVCRVIPARILTIRDLLLPPVLEKICEETRGLILVTGTTGSGKSTSLAAMIDYINATRAEHIMTIEDPVEFLHRDKKSIINQRELEVDTRSFASAIRAALRQDPDVILVGEMRDFETVETALVAAETGHLVMSTLHTMDATETVNRIISVFPPHQQKQIRLQLAAVIKAVCSMRLLPRADGLGRVPAVEVMIATNYIRDCIENKEKTKYITDAIKAGTSQYGMQTFDQSLFQLYKTGLITLDEAIRRSTNPNEFKLKVQGIQSTSDIANELMEGSLQAPDGVGPRDAESPFDFSNQSTGLGAPPRSPRLGFLGPPGPTRGSSCARKLLEERASPARRRSRPVSTASPSGASSTTRPRRPPSPPRAHGRGGAAAHIASELAAKGISRKDAEAALATLDPADEARSLKRALERRARALPSGLTGRARSKKLFDHLVRRGFAPSAVLEAIRTKGESTDDDP